MVETLVEDIGNTQEPAGNSEVVMTKLEIELPEKWVNMIRAKFEWEDEPVDIQGYIRGAVASWLECDIYNLSSDPLKILEG